ncbi:MAG: DUF924 family protein [Burkholderiaceae bacterium]
MDPARILDFWFGAPGDPDHGRARDAWFRKDDAFDARIRDTFGDAIVAGVRGELQAWLDAPASALAYVVLLDQFTRNAFRGTPNAFSGDACALAAARQIVASGWDAGYAPVQRWFCYLPFEHSESLADQRESLRLFATLRGDPVAGGAYEWAVKHHDVIVRFGRFPHRNEILGRASGPDELAFLALPGSRF